VWKKGSSGPVTQWRQLVSCHWSWHSHGSLVRGKFDLKINRSTRPPWQEYSGVACSYSSAPDSNKSEYRIIVRKIFTTITERSNRNSVITFKSDMETSLTHKWWYAWKKKALVCARKKTNKEEVRVKQGRSESRERYLSSVKVAHVWIEKSDCWTDKWLAVTARTKTQHTWLLH